MPPRSYPGPDPEAIRSSLLEHADDYARDYLDYPLTNDARRELDRLLAEAVHGMSVDRRLDEQSYVRAQKAVERWLMRAGPERLQEAVQPGPARIEEVDLLESLRGLCPGFWPFC